MENTNLAWIIGGIAILFLLFGMPFGGRSGGMMGMMYPSYSYSMMGGFAFGWLFMLLIIVALVLLIAWLVQQLNRGHRRR